MWRLKQLMPKDQAGLEGKTIDLGSLKLQVRSTIAQGGFSCVYLAKDPQSAKQYALKHIICNDSESLDLVKKEVAVMKDLRGHPNIVTLHTQAMFDMGRTKECFLLMDYCEKVLVSVLDARGSGYFEEKQLLLIFRDICNAVFAMHSQSPPIAHRDLKVENVLLGGDGHWKLCDFGSTSSNHKCYEKAEEMGIEEDIIRKHTTPAYRAPEMWDLYRKELINEKVDIWALGCLLFRMAYLKSAFDGDSKLQILNGNYRIPDLPKFSNTVTGLIKDMLNADPQARPDVLQVWRKVNDALPPEFQKGGPDSSASTRKSQPQNQETVDSRNGGRSKHSPVMPSRAAPRPPQREAEQPSPPLATKKAERRSPPLVAKEPDQHSSHGTELNASVGSFWSSKFAEAVKVKDDKSPVYNKAGDRSSSMSKSANSHAASISSSPPGEHFIEGRDFGKRGAPYINKKGHDLQHHVGDNARENPNLEGRAWKRDEKAESKDASSEAVRPSSDEAFSAFVAEFQSSNVAGNKTTGKESLQIEVERLKGELTELSKEKEELALKCKKLTVLCRSQQQEIQQLKSMVQAINNQPVESVSKETFSQTKLTSSQSSLVHPQRKEDPSQCKSGPSDVGSLWKQSEKQAGPIWDLHENIHSSSSQRFLETKVQQELGVFEGIPRHLFGINTNKQGQAGISDSVDSPRLNSEIERTMSGRRHQQHARAISFAGDDNWVPVHDTFSSLGSTFQSSKVAGQVSSQAGMAFPSSSTRESSSSKGDNRGSKPMNKSQPAGWAGF